MRDFAVAMPWLRTDLALEAKDMFAREKAFDCGINVEEATDDGVKISRVEVLDEDAARLLKKPCGKYITLDVPRDFGWQKNTGDILARELNHLLNLKNSLVLVVGLGNRAITADSLGPRILDDIAVTRHLKPILEKKHRESMNFICAVEPSVFGATGIEAFEMIKGIVDKVKPDAVIAADALAAASTRRLNATIQLADTGIHPGSGVDNKRFGLTRESLGVPVVAVGIPTVVYASTIALDLMAVLEEHAPFASYFRSMRDIPLNAQRTLINQLIPDFMKDLVVSPKEADIFMADMAKTLAEGINKAVYGDIDYRHMENYLA